MESLFLLVGGFWGLPVTKRNLDRRLKRIRKTPKAYPVRINRIKLYIEIVDVNQ